MSRQRRLILWRHGRTQWNAGGRFQGQLDPPLDELGQRQAELAGKLLAQLEPDEVVSSDLVRAYDTAQAVGLAVRREERLREIHLGDWQGLTRQEARERFPEEYAEWQIGGDVRRGGGETYSEVGTRAAAALEETLCALEPGATVLAVSHGGTIRSAIGTLLQLDVLSWWRLGPLGNCRWSVVVENRRGWQLDEHNAGSLPMEVSGDDAR